MGGSEQVQQHAMWDSVWLLPKEGSACWETWQQGPLQLGAGMRQVKQATAVVDVMMHATCDALHHREVMQDLRHGCWHSSLPKHKTARQLTVPV